MLSEARQGVFPIASPQVKIIYILPYFNGIFPKQKNIFFVFVNNFFVSFTDSYKGLSKNKVV